MIEPIIILSDDDLPVSANVLTNLYTLNYFILAFIGKMAGVISERDYIKKVSLLGKTSKETKIKEIFTQDANVITASEDDSIDTAMEKMMSKSIRHLPIVNKTGDLVGFVSIKDLIKEVVVDKENTLRALSDSVFGK